MWCHVLLATPLLGLALFFVLPFGLALALYLILVLLSLAIYAKIAESMRAPLTTGREALVGQIVTTTHDGSIRWQGEWWTARPRLPACLSACRGAARSGGTGRASGAIAASPHRSHVKNSHFVHNHRVESRRTEQARLDARTHWVR